MGNVTKVVLLFREQWWPQAAFVQALKEPFPTWWDDPRGPILTAWAGGPKADALLELSSPRLRALCAEVAARIFGVRPAFVQARLLEVFSHQWANDRHFRGAYSYIPVNGLDLPKTLGAPVQDILFFAGEATVTDSQTGTVFGALESGLRAAGEALGIRSNASPRRPMWLGPWQGDE